MKWLIVLGALAAAAMAVLLQRADPAPLTSAQEASPNKVPASTSATVAEDGGGASRSAVVTAEAAAPSPVEANEGASKYPEPGPEAKRMLGLLATAARSAELEFPQSWAFPPEVMERLEKLGMDYEFAVQNVQREIAPLVSEAVSTKVDAGQFESYSHPDQAGSPEAVEEQRAALRRAKQPRVDGERVSVQSSPQFVRVIRILPGEFPALDVHYSKLNDLNSYYAGAALELLRTK